MKTFPLADIPHLFFLRAEQPTGWHGAMPETALNMGGGVHNTAQGGDDAPLPPQSPEGPVTKNPTVDLHPAKKPLADEWGSSYHFSCAF